jgi:hypothetical protein
MGKIMMYDLGFEGEDGEEFGGEVREIRPLLSYEAHGGMPSISLHLFRY